MELQQLVVCGAHTAHSRTTVRTGSSCLAQQCRQLLPAAESEPKTCKARSFAAPPVDGDMLRIAVERKTEKHEEFEAQKEQRKGHTARIHQ